MKITVTIYSDGETAVDAPDGVDVEIVYATADTDAYCGCGCIIRREDDEDIDGNTITYWYHVDAPEIWGNDHDAHPD